MNITGSLTVNGSPVLTDPTAFDAAGTATNSVAIYSNYVSNTYYPNSNPSNFVTASVTNNCYPNNNPSNFVTGVVTAGLATVTLVTSTSNALQSGINVAMTNYVAANNIALTNYVGSLNAYSNALNNSIGVAITNYQGPLNSYSNALNNSINIAMTNYVAANNIALTNYVGPLNSYSNALNNSINIASTNYQGPLNAYSNALNNSISIAKTNYQGPLNSYSNALNNSIGVAMTNYQGSLNSYSNALNTQTTNLVTITSNALQSSINIAATNYVAADNISRTNYQGSYIYTTNLLTTTINPTVSYGIFSGTSGTISQTSLLGPTQPWYITNNWTVTVSPALTAGQQIDLIVRHSAANHVITWPANMIPQTSGLTLSDTNTTGYTDAYSILCYGTNITGTIWTNLYKYSGAAQ